MCRFVAYLGTRTLLADLLYRPRHSLVAQSRTAEMMSIPFNADGFGVAWYEDQEDASPCVVRAPYPAWSNRSFESIAYNVRSHCVFAHVRAASPGLPVQETNTHPFFVGRHLFMHNGQFDGFLRYRRRLLQTLSDEAWHAIQGSTDSEHAFAIWLDAADRSVVGDGQRLGAGLQDMLVRLNAISRDAGVETSLRGNFAVTDGRGLAVCRYASGGAQAASLYYSAGTGYAVADGDGDMVGEGANPAPVMIVASEPLTRRAEDWQALPEQSLLTVDSDGSHRVTSLDVVATSRSH